MNNTENDLTRGELDCDFMVPVVIIASTDFKKLVESYEENSSNNMKYKTKKIEPLDNKLLRAVTQIQPHWKYLNYILAKSPYCEVVFDSNHPSQLVRISIQRLEEYFSSLQRVHNSYLVNPEKILWIQKSKNKKNEIVMKNKKLIPISISYIDEIKLKYEFYDSSYLIRKKMRKII